MNPLASRRLLCCLLCVTLLPAAGFATDATWFVAVKGQHFTQTTTGAAVLDSGLPYRFSVSVLTSCDSSLTNATLKLANGVIADLINEGSSWNISGAEYSSQALLDAAFPNGTNRMNLYTRNDGFKTNMPVIVSGNNYPTTAPRFTNYTAAQSVNAGASFLLGWDAFSGGTTNDYIHVEISDTNHNPVFRMPLYGYSGALNGTNTFFVIPTNTLAPGTAYEVIVAFARLVPNFTNYPGVPGAGGYYKQTSMSLVTTGAVETVAPSFVRSSPRDGATNVMRNVPVGFTFSEPMRGNYSINWSGNVDSCNFSYTWSLDKRSLICIYQTNLPANATISWTLQPSGGGDQFQDLAGNSLNVSDQSGSFTTGAGTNAHDVLIYGCGKQQRFSQTNSAVATVTNQFKFQAFASLAAAFTVTNGSVRASNGVAQVMSRDPESDGADFGFEQTFASQALLDSTFTNGPYIITLDTVHEGTKIATNSLTGNSYPNVPHVSNFTAAQAVNVATNFTLTWDAFTGGTTNDFIQVSLRNDFGDEVSSGNYPGAAGALNGLSNSFVIPPGVLQAGQTYRGDLMFAKLVTRNTNAYPGVLGVAFYARQTEFNLVTAAGSPRLSAPARISPTQFQFLLTGSAGQNYTILSSSNLVTWSTNFITNAPFSPFTVTVPNATGARSYYRALVGP